MGDSDFEIECLDEDIEVVQQCVRSLPTTATISTKQHQYRGQQRPSLLVERPQTQKRKKIEEDSEYEPSDDNLPPSPPSSPTIKKKPKQPAPKKPRTTYPTTISNKAYLKIGKHPHLYVPSVHEEFLMRRKCNIRIPDYEDPLCLPVRALKADESDVKRLNNWNNVCLEHFKHCDTLLKPEQGNIKRSTRTAVFKNVVNKHTGQSETTIWSKTCVENEDSDKKSEIFQSVLPRYREKKSLPNFLLEPKREQTGSKSVFEVVLSKETHKDGEALVVYKPQDSVVAVYGLIDKRKKSEDGEAPINHDEDSPLFLKELTSCRLCAPCFQSSWRGTPKNKNKSVVCPVCGRSCATAYNLLSHFKTHTANAVSRYRKIISSLLGEMVEYHYRCRVCRRKFDSIRALREHTAEHQGKEKFTCDVCNRLVYPTE